MPNSPALLSAQEMLDGYRSRRLSPVEVIDACLETIERHDPVLNAMCLVDADGARSAAQVSESRWQAGSPIGPLDGVPATIKDLVLAKGWPTLRGSKTVNPNQPMDQDAPVTARLREAGAILIGKTTTPEFGYKGVTDNPLTGITRNPWNPDMTPGGSSGGASVAAATGMAALNVGTDGGGSIRIPAALTGIVGLKASFGRVPVWPPSPFAALSHAGPMTRTVADAALMLTTISRPDHRDWTSLPYDGTDYTAGLDPSLKGLRIGYTKTLLNAPVDPDIASCVDRAVSALAELGADIIPVDPPVEGCAEVFDVLWTGACALLLGSMSEDQLAVVDPGLVATADHGRRFTATDIQNATNRRNRIGTAMNAFMESIDVLVLPTIPIAAFTAGQNHPTPGKHEWDDWTPFTWPFNVTSQPAISVPCGLTPHGLPTGLQIVGPRFADHRVLRVAAAYERVHPAALPNLAP